MTKERDKDLIEVEKNSKVYYDYFTNLYKGNKSTVIYYTATNTLTRSSIINLLPGRWLNDEIINLFMEYLSCREEKRNTEREDGKVVKKICTHFLTKMSSSSFSGGEVDGLAGTLVHGRAKYGMLRAKTLVLLAQAAWTLGEAQRLAG